MKRSLPTLIALLLLSACASTGSNYYNYEGSGDYYYGATAADAVINSSPYGYGWSGSNYGFGSGFGYGFGAGFGYGYGYGGGYGYGWPYSYWGYGYQPIWWVPSHPDQGPQVTRSDFVQRDRAIRAGLVRRDTVQAPQSKIGFHADRSSRAWFNPATRRSGVGEYPASSRVAPARRSAAPLRGQTFRSSPPAATRSAPPPAPVRSAPSPQRAPHRQ